MNIDVHWHYMPEEFVTTIRAENHPWPISAVRDERGAEWLASGSFRHPLLPVLYQPEAQVAAIDLLGADHMMLGSDLPFDMGDVDPVATLTRTPGPDAVARQMVLGGTAARLLGV